MNKKRLLELLKIVRRYLRNEPSHGIPHILRVHYNFQLFKSENPKVSERVLTVTELACLFHDIGRSKTTIEKWQNHSNISRDMLKGLFKKELADFRPYEESILYAVDFHEDWIKSSPREEKEICLGLLALFDIMDAIGGMALFRIGVGWGLKVPWLPESGGWSKERIKNYIEHPGKIKKENRAAMMKNSILVALLYSYCAMISKILPPVRKYLGPKILKEIQRRLDVLRIFITDSLGFINYPF